MGERARYEIARLVAVAVRFAARFAPRAAAALDAPPLPASDAAPTSAAAPLPHQQAAGRTRFEVQLALYLEQRRRDVGVDLDRLDAVDRLEELYLGC